MFLSVVIAVTQKTVFLRVRIIRIICWCRVHVTTYNWRHKTWNHSFRRIFDRIVMKGSDWFIERSECDDLSSHRMMMFVNIYCVKDRRLLKGSHTHTQLTCVTAYDISTGRNTTVWCVHMLFIKWMIICSCSWSNESVSGLFCMDSRCRTGPHTSSDVNIYAQKPQHWTTSLELQL